MSQSNENNEPSYKITQIVTTAENDLKKLNKYLNVYKSKEKKNSYYSQLSEIFPKLFKFFTEFEHKKTRIQELKTKINALKNAKTNAEIETESQLANIEETMSDKDELVYEIREYQKREEEMIAQKKFIAEEYEISKERHDIFERYGRIYIKFAIPIRFAILEYLYESKNNLTSNMIIKYLTSNPEIKINYPDINRQNIYSSIKKLRELGYIDRIDIGLYHISKMGQKYYLESDPNHKSNDEVEGKK